jgi:hypothetical protein
MNRVKFLYMHQRTIPLYHHLIDDLNSLSNGDIFLGFFNRQGVKIDGSELQSSVVMNMEKLR